MIERVNLARIVEGLQRWVVAGYFNAAHPRWTGKPGVRGAWREVLELLQRGVLANCVGKPTFQRMLRSRKTQETIIDLTISSGVMIWDIDDQWAMGSQHRTLTWQAEPEKGEEIKEPVRKYWKVRRPQLVKTKEGIVDERKVWKEEWRNRERGKRLGEAVTKWADKIWEKGEFHPGAKRWWTKELTEARKEYGKQRKTKENRKK